MWLKQSTTIALSLGPFLDKTDGVTEEAGLAGTMTVNLSKNGGALGARNSATAIAYDAGGDYLVELDGTDTGTLGRLRVQVNDAATHLPVWQDFMVVPANVWDSLFGADLLQVDLTEIGGAAQSAADLKDFADAGYDPATHKVEEVKVLSGHTAQGGDSFARLGAPAGLSVSADVAAVKGDSAAILTDTADMQPKLGAPAGASMSADIAAVKAQTAGIEADTQDLQAQIGTAGDGLTALAQFIDTEVADIKAKTDNLPPNPAAATDIPGAPAIADAVWDEDRAGHAGVGSFGEGAASVQGNVAGSVASVTDPVTVGTNNDKTGYSLTAAEENTIADKVWDEARADHVAAGSFGQAGQIVRSGTAQAGAVDSITLDAGASGVNDLYRDQIVSLIAGAGAGQSRRITAYDSGTKIATVDTDWVAQPDATSVFLILPGTTFASFSATERAAIADKLLGRNIAGGSDGGRSVTSALRSIRNKVDTASVPGKAIIYREDDTTEDHQRDLTTDASALPIVTADPTT